MMMKFVICLLAFASSVLALPADISFEVDELDVSKLIPNNIYLEPVNPVDQTRIPEDRIIGGSEVRANSVPYQAAIIINGVSFCGGSLISTAIVLTAAHCTERASFVQIRLGAHNYGINEATQSRITSTSIINHENYDVGSFAANDVALILLPSAAPLTNAISTIPLAPANAPSYAGSTAFLAGWGRTSDESSIGSATLRGINLSIMTNSACVAIYGRDIVDSSLCTSGAGNVGSCNGDSGGPLVVDGVQVGVVSFGTLTCASGNPSVFARVSSFRDWIFQNSGV